MGTNTLAYFGGQIKLYNQSAKKTTEGDKHSALFWQLNKVLSSISSDNSLGGKRSSLFWLINKV